ncbi:MAG TPA: carboxypeptidase regulatory-like domain-containing protein [Gemmatimonadaceae bacterium]
MKQASSSQRPTAGWRIVAALACVLAVPAARAQTGNPPASTSPGGLATVKGFLTDSIHNTSLSKALVIVEGANRSTATDADGHYVIDSIPPGPHRVSVLHPLLDTLGVLMRSPEIPFAAGEMKDLDLSIPSPERLANIFCTSAQRSRGPAMMVGFVRDPDNNGPAIGSKVQLVYYEPDLIGRKQLRTREATVDSTGGYKICGLPGDMSGKVQVFRNGVSSGEVPAEVTNGFLALRGFSIVSQHQAVVEVKGDSGKVKRVAKGSARVTGRVIDKKGQPLRDARITLQGGGDVVALSKANGEFTLDSLPSGTQAIEVRKLGYSVTEVPVELSSNNTTAANVTMSDAVPMLQTMRIEAAQDKALSDIGYLQRKQSGMGRFYDGKQINHESMSFSDVMRIDPGLRISPAGDGRTYVISDARNAAGGCVNVYVDGTYWEPMQPGDIDSYVRPNEMVAVEVYHGSETPPQFTKPGQSGCATIVVWTLARARPRETNSKKPR